jgi:hypothetical protein
VKSLYSAVAQRAGHRCEYCHAPEAAFNFPFEVEHVVPKSLQGSDEEDNRALACRACNVRKSDFQTGLDETTGAEVPLFHPCLDSWEEHFRVDHETAEIQGLTPTGRATIARLQMNSPVQVDARRLWMRLGLFP